jgi:hypothetical protein
MRRRFDLTPLGHPVFWGALALLVVNDDLLKGRGLVPGWLTGKLSDFAFLIVAPIVLAALIPRRVPGRRAAAVAAVTALFVAADLSRAVSDAVIALAARVGFTWRLWPDPTDLLALAVLPITVWLLRRTPQPPAGVVARRMRVPRERAGVVLGALACLATSSEPINYHSPFLLNRTTAAADVHITWVLRQLDCETATPEALGATLNPNDLDDRRTVSLASGQVAALDGPPPPDKSPAGACFTNRAYPIPDEACVAAILESPGASPVLMVAPNRWEPIDTDTSWCSSGPPYSQCDLVLDPNRSPGPDAISLRNVGGVVRFELSGTGPGEQLPAQSRVKLAPIDLTALAARAPAPDGCRALRDTYRSWMQMSACTADSDCQVLPGLSLPGEMEICEFYVNQNVSSAAYTTLANQWEAACATSTESCSPPKPAACRQGICGPSSAPTVGPPDPVPDAGAGDASMDAGADAQDDTAVDAAG